MSRKALRYVLALIVVVVIVFAGWRVLDNRNQASQTVRIATFSVAIDYAPYYVAMEKGYFAEELAKIGLTPEFSRFDALPPLNDALRLNQLDAVFEAEPPALIAEATGIDVEIGEISATLTQRIIVRRDSGITSLSDLEGKKIGVLTGTSSHYGILQSLQNAGVSPESVTIVNLPPAEGRAAFRSGQIDAWAIWPPFPEHEQLEGDAIELPASEATIQSLLVLDGDFLAANPEAAAAIDRAVDRAKLDIAANPAEAQQLVARATGEPIEVVRAAWPKHNFAATLDSAVRQDIGAKARFLYEDNFLARPVDPATALFDNPIQ